MAEKTINYKFNDFDVTVIIPENFNGKWIWKTEFLYAFDKAEVELCKQGYTRVYYKISDMYGCYRAIRLMYKFYLHIIEKFNLDKKCVLFGFSRGGLYAFNYALSHPDTVDKIYLDAPVLDLTTWPPKTENADKKCYDEMLGCYNFTDDTLLTFKDMPVNNLKEFFDYKLPMLLIVGDNDQVVSYERNSLKVIEYCKRNSIPLEYYVKRGAGHHPHSLEDVEPIINFVCGRS